MDPKNKIKWKNPYKKEIREDHLIEIWHNISDNNAGKLTPIIKRYTARKKKNYIEKELTKYIYTNKKKNTTKKYFVIGSICSLLYYTYISKKRQLIEDSIDPGRFLIYNEWLFLRQREYNFYFWNFIDLNGNLFGQSFSRRPRDDVLGVEKVKLPWVLAGQIGSYRKRKDDVFDFLNIGEEEIFKLL